MESLLNKDNEIEPKWLKIARMEDGVSEIPGKKTNPRILEYKKFTTLKSTSDEEAWCSDFICFCMEKVGINSTKSARARSWLFWGKQLKEPRLGCVVVLRRGKNPSLGHVTFFLKEVGNKILCYGGNQGNKVCEKLFAKSDVLAYVWPKNVK